MSDQFTPGVVLSQLTIADLTVGGGAVARHEGRVIFLDRGLPQEIVNARVTEEKKRIVYAEVIETLTPSPDAIEPWCPHFSLCGACTWQNLRPEALLRWKEQHIRQTLARIGKVTDIPVASIQSSPAMREYRSKMAYACIPGEYGVLIGLRQRASRAVVEVTHCGMQSSAAMEVLALIRTMIERLEVSAWNGRTGLLRFIVLHTPNALLEGKPQLLVECITSGEGSSDAHATRIRELGEALITCNSVTGFAHTCRTAASDVAQGERTIATLGQTTIQEQFNSLPIDAPFSAFLQTNTPAANLLYAQIAASANLTGAEIVWDLYCGVGGIGLSLAPHAASLHGFELNKEAIAAAKQNSRNHGHGHCRFTAGDLATTMKKQRETPDCIIMDPPRAGLDAAVTAALCAIPAKKLIYASCDVATQARDITRLSCAWRPIAAFPVDMFPYTPHVENIVVLERI